MKERPILFSGAMVRALLAGTKTLTRRVMKPQPFLNDQGETWWLSSKARSAVSLDSERAAVCALGPYGAPGDRLWVKETYHSERQEQPGTDTVRWVVRTHGGFGEKCGAFYRATYDDVAARALRWRPSIHMPRCLSRITLDVAAVRVERLHDITEEDARAEGVDVIKAKVPTARDAFEYLWRDINGDDSWAANPWVWVVGFKRVEATP